MGNSRHRPLLHASDRKLRNRLIGLAGALVVIIVLLILIAKQDPYIWKNLKFKSYEIFFQFLVIAAGGGVLVAIITNFRDEATRRQERAALIQVLQRELDGAFRSIKKIRRSLRANRVHSSFPNAISRDVMDKAMSDFLDAQLEVETICEHIWQRDDILSPQHLKQMREPLRYASRYYHDVFEDFEKGRIKLVDDHYELKDAPNILDYLKGRRDPPTLRPVDVDLALSQLKDSSQLAASRTAALDALIEASPLDITTDGTGHGKFRYLDVARACAELISHELTQVRNKLLL